MTQDTGVREMLARVLSWEDAHAGFEAATANLPAALRGRTPDGVPWSPWQLLEHLRITQHDILDFCVNPGYTGIEWPKEYWPASPEPPSDEAWQHSVDRFLEDREALKALAADSTRDLTATIPHGSGQTWLRELLLAADHTSYHVGQLVLVRRLLGAWT